MRSEAAYFPDAFANTGEECPAKGSPLEAQVFSVQDEVQRAGGCPPLKLITVSDEELMTQIRAEEKEALGQLFCRYARAVRNVAYRILRDEAEADDLVQDVFLFLFRKAHLYNPEKGTAITWIIHVAYHRAFDRRRYLNARKFYASEEIEPHADRLADPRKQISFDTQSWDGVLGRKLADRFRSRLTPEQQETLQLVFFEGYALREIAEMTGRSLVSVRSHYYRGLERLRQYVLPQAKQSK